MKKLLLSAVMACGVLTGAAQTNIFDNPANKAYFGVRAALDIACPSNVKAAGMSWNIYDPGAGFSAGAIYNMPLVANLYFEPGVNLYYNTFSVNIDEYEGAEIDASLRKFGVRVPLQFGYHFDFTPNISVALFTGPEFEIGCTARVHAKATEGIVSTSDSESAYGDGGMERFDCLWKFGASVTYAHNYYLGVGGGVGIVNMSGNSEAKYHENLTQITLGYNF